MKLNQVIALVTGKKARATKLLTDVHRGWNREAISGISRTYSPKEEDGEVFPSESKLIQLNVESALEETTKQLADFYNLVAMQETANTQAKACVVVDGEGLLENVPVSVLLFLEKQLTDLRTLATNLPTLPEDKEWDFDSNKNCYVSKQEQTLKTKKVIEPIVKYHATKEHPAQTDLINKDKIIGNWTTIHLSSALPKEDKEMIIRRINKLQDAVKVAREEANSVEVEQEIRLGGKIFEYIFDRKVNRAQIQV